MKIARFGSISEGTTREEDLIPAFCEELRYLRHRSTELNRIIRESNTRKYWNDDNQDNRSWDLNECLFDMLNEHAPACAYFGSHPGDGSDYGFWISDMLEYEFDGLKVEDLSDIPQDYHGSILLINDHGNMSLYNRGMNGHLYERWSVV